VRVTPISMSSQADALGQIIGGPILGAIATILTTRVEMVAAAIEPLARPTRKTVRLGKRHADHWKPFLLRHDTLGPMCWSRQTSRRKKTLHH
jgi:hypothetical protein